MAAGRDPPHPIGIPGGNGNDAVAAGSARQSHVPIRACQEQELVARAGARDRDAFQELYRRHVHVVAGFVGRRVRPADVDDVVADTFVAAWRAIDRYEWRGVSTRAWLVTIAGRQIIARSRRRQSAELIIEDLDPLLDAATFDADIDRVTDRLDLRRALADLSPEQRLAVELRHVADLSAEDTAVLLGIAPEAVRARTYRALAVLRATLTDPAVPPY